jgi:hypothetical protein
LPRFRATLIGVYASVDTQTAGAQGGQNSRQIAEFDATSLINDKHDKFRDCSSFAGNGNVTMAVTSLSSRQGGVAPASSAAIVQLQVIMPRKICAFPVKCFCLGARHAFVHWHDHLCVDKGVEPHHGHKVPASIVLVHRRIHQHASGPSHARLCPSCLWSSSSECRLQLLDAADQAASKCKAAQQLAAAVLDAVQAALSNLPSCKLVSDERQDLLAPFHMPAGYTVSFSAPQCVQLTGPGLFKVRAAHETADTCSTRHCVPWPTCPLTLWCTSLVLVACP